MNTYYFKRKTSLNSYKDSLDLLKVIGKDLLLASNKIPQTMIKSFWVGESADDIPFQESHNHLNKWEHVCTTKNMGSDTEIEFLSLQDTETNKNIWKKAVFNFKTNNLDITDIKLKNQILYKKLHPEL